MRLKSLFHYTFGCIFLLCAHACVERKSTASMSDNIELPVPPTTILDPQARASYIVQNVWNHHDTLVPSNFASKEKLVQFLVDYLAIGIQADEETFSASVAKALDRCSTDFYAELMDVGEIHLDHPNSFIYSDRTYALLLREALKCRHLTYADSVRYEYRLELYERNKPGDIAADFAFKTDDGRRLLLSQVESPLLALVFYEPDCPVCAETFAYISADPVLGEAVDQGYLKLLCIYAGRERELDKRHQAQLPTFAIHGVDEDLKIVNEELYFLRAFPTIYLLDDTKAVLKRDIPIDLLSDWISNTYNYKN